MATDLFCIIDFSKSSVISLRWSVELAQKLRSEIDIVYPYRLPPLHKNADIVQTKKILESEAAEKFAKLVPHVFEGKNVKYSFRSEVGFAIDRIQDHIKKRQVGFIIINKNTIGEPKTILSELIDSINIPIIIAPSFPAS